MSLSAREKVLRVRWAQHQVTQLQRKMIRSFPAVQTEQPLEVTTDGTLPDEVPNDNFNDEPSDSYSVSENLARKNFVVSLPPNGPSRALSVPNSPIPTRSKSSRSFAGSLTGDDETPPPPTNHSDETKARKAPRTKSKKSRRKSRISRGPIADSVPQVAAENNNGTSGTSTSIVAPLMKTKSSVETMKKKSKQSSASALSRQSKDKLKSESSQGRMFRHRYSFQDSTEPSPNASKTSSNIPISKKLGPIGIPPGKRLPIPGVPRITSPSGSDIISPPRSLRELNNNYDPDEDEDTYSLNRSVTSGQKQFIFGGASRENLCIPSLLFTKKAINERRVSGKKTWVEKRFPKLADEVESWHKRFPFMKPGIEGTNDGGGGPLRHKKYKPSNKLADQFNNETYHQPPPHKRGLVGVEISEFNADCAVFYQGQNGLYNPHLHEAPTEKDLHPGILSSRSARKFLWSPASSKSLQRIRFKDEPHYKSKSKIDNELF